jgi:hypothetical protein
MARATKVLHVPLLSAGEDEIFRVSPPSSLGLLDVLSDPLQRASRAKRLRCRDGVLAHPESRIVQRLAVVGHQENDEGNLAYEANVTCVKREDPP